MISNPKISFLSITIYLLYFYLFVDTLNGLIIRNYDFSFSPWFENIFESFKYISDQNFKEECTFDSSKYTRQFGLEKLIGLIEKL